MDVSYAAEAGAVLDALLAAISATDTDEGEGGEGTLRAFESLDEWRAFVQRLVSKQAFASCVIDFPFADATDGGLNLLGDKRLLERMCCFHDPEADVPSDWGRQEKRRRRTWLVVVHVHTLLEWGVCKKWKEAEPLREVTSVNVRHATWVARSGWQQERRKLKLVPQNRTLSQNWRTFWRQGQKDKIVWDPHDDISVPDDDHNAQRTYSGLRVVIRAGDALCSGTMMTETLKQTQAVMRGGEEVECKVVGLASAKLRT